MESPELMNQNIFQTKFLEERVHIPPSRKKDDHINWINMQISGATVVEPTGIMRTNAAELEILTAWFSRVVPSWIRRGISDLQRLYPMKANRMPNLFRRDADDLCGLPIAP